MGIESMQPQSGRMLKEDGSMVNIANLLEFFAAGSGYVAPDNYLYVGKNGNDETGDGSANMPYLTIQAAITGASSGTTVFIFPGTYAEDLTLKAGVNLTAPSKFSVYVTGKVTANYTGTVYAENIIFQNDDDYVLSFDGIGAQSFQTLACNFIGLTGNNANAINYTNTSTSSKIYISSGVVTVYTSSGGAKAINSASTAKGGILLENTTVQLLDNPNNVVVNLGGAIAYTHTRDQITGQVVVANTSSATIAFVAMTTTSVAVLTTTSSGASTVINPLVTTTSTPAFSGSGVFIAVAVGYLSTGVGGADTLNGGAGPTILALGGLRLRATGLYPTPQGGAFEYDGANLYFTIGSTRKIVTLADIE